MGADIDIEAAIKYKQWSLVAKYATKHGKYTNESEQLIKVKLVAYAKTLSSMGHSDPAEIMMSILQFLGL